MTWIVFGFVVVVAIIFVSVVIGKSIDENEKEYVGNKRNNEEYGYGKDEV